MNQRGGSLVEMMVISGVMLAFTISMYSVLTFGNNTSNQMRGDFEYNNMIESVRPEINFDRSCGKIFGDVGIFNNYNPLEEYKIKHIDTSVGMLNSDEVIGGTTLTLRSISLSPTNDSRDIKLKIGGVTNLYKGYVAELIIKADRGDGTRRQTPQKVPMFFYINTVTGVAEYCAANFDAQTCRNIGGYYTPKQDDIVSQCDLRVSVGGCSKGGSFTVDGNGGCTAANSYTGGCSCPATDPSVGYKYTAYTVANFAISKGATMIQKECLSCAADVAASYATAGDPVYDEDAAEDALECAENPTVCQACQTYGETDPRCLCSTDPENAACQTNGNYDTCKVWGANTCQCVSQLAAQACGGNPLSQASGCPEAMAKQNVICLAGYGSVNNPSAPSAPSAPSIPARSGGPSSSTRRTLQN